ncbi:MULTISPECIES: DUF6234 family protein [Streptomyces]|uniref:DUF6234 family protein n=1 Tax=Streptomyces TaxID=1883 RepID=UPI00163CC210|nr:MULTISPECIES: DUF6234 family protein [Streptomyces]MBC2876500.1 hypothetical protein [Streptomyces sp. TYQ1024]UBI40823.1 DUF6234 family protein [Streptomyces mobaraensis]
MSGTTKHTATGDAGRARPSIGQEIGLSLALLLLDLMVMAWFFYGYGITAWADGYDTPNAPEAPGVARQAMWVLAGGAVVTGGGLLALRRPVAGAFQLLVLGTGAAFFADLASR